MEVNRHGRRRLRQKDARFQLRAFQFYSLHSQLQSTQYFDDNSANGGAVNY